MIRKHQYGLNTANEMSDDVWGDVQVHVAEDHSVRWNAYVRQGVNGSGKVHDGGNDEKTWDLQMEDMPHSWQVRGGYRPRQTVESSDDSAPRWEKPADESPASCDATTLGKTGAI